MADNDCFRRSRANRGCRSYPPGGYSDLTARSAIWRLKRGDGWSTALGEARGRSRAESGPVLAAQAKWKPPRAGLP